MEIKKTKKEIINELLRTKEDLEDLEKYIEELFNFLPIAFCLINPAQIILDINKAFENLTNYQPNEIIGKSITKILKDKNKIKKIIKETFKTGNQIQESVVLSKKGKEIPVSISISVRKDRLGNFIGYFLSFTDITLLKERQIAIEREVQERTKELEQSRLALMSILEDVESSKNALMNILEDNEEERKKVEKEKNRTQSILNNLTDGILFLNEENKFSFINPQAELLLRIDNEKIINKNFSELPNLPNLKPIIELLIEEKEKIFRQEKEINPNLILEISVVPIPIQEGQKGKIIILHDVTREKTVERLKTEFVSLAAHQLRTPLSAIKWTLKSLLDGDLGEITPEQRNFIEKTYVSNERMISLINDLLNVTRIEEGRYLYKLTMANIEEIVENLLTHYKGELERKNIKFELIKPPKKLPLVFVDTEKINLAIQNLLENAICYTMPGGQITISLSFDQKNIMFSITDSGIGIPEDQKDRIFTKFFRAENAKRIDTEGSGLGLFIVKNIIEAHGGKIWFESKENQGSTFYFTLPIKEEFSEFLTKF